MHRVTVLTPTYNYGRFLEDAIKSVSFQSDASLEHIIQDGASSDSTASVLDKYDEIVTWRSVEDSGQSEALNSALALAKGRWIGWLNADEFYLPDGLEMLVREADRSGADVVYGDAIFVDERGRLMRLFPQHWFQAWVLRWYGCFIPSCSTVFRREALGDVPWDVSLRRVMDLDLYLRLVSEGARFRYLKWPVGAFRVHEDQVTAVPRESHSEEWQVLKTRYGVRLGMGKSVGRAIHGLEKLAAGAYKRQLRARRLAGRDMRWFGSEYGERNVRILLEQIYGSGERSAAE